MIIYHGFYIKKKLLCKYIEMFVSLPTIITFYFMIENKGINTKKQLSWKTVDRLRTHELRVLRGAPNYYNRSATLVAP